MEFDTTLKEEEYCTTKSWAKDKQSRKYNSRRDYRKANPNGSVLKRLDDTYSIYNGMYRDNKDQIELECNGGINPIEKYLNILKPNPNDIHSNLNKILNNTNPTQIKYQKCNGKRDGDILCRSNRWIIHYRYTPQQQYEEYYYNLQKEKAMKKHNKQYVKAKKLSNHKHKGNKLQQKEYKPPNVEEEELNYTKSDILLDKQCQHYIQYDLGKNKWITACSTGYAWKVYRHSYRYKIGSYKLYIAVDDDDKDKRFFKMDDNVEFEQKKVSKKHKKKKKRVNICNERQRRKRDRKEMWKESKEKKMNDKLKWEYVGLFDGSLKGFYFDREKDYEISKVYKINYNTYYDYNDNGTMKKNYCKNGKLCRWIKLVPCDNSYDFDMLQSKIYGVEVDDYSQPIIPYKRMDKNDFILSGYAKDDEYDASDDGDYGDYAKDDEDGFHYRMNNNFQIGPSIDKEEIKERKGCRLIIKEKRKYIPFGRVIDGGEDHMRYWTDWYLQGKIERVKKHRKYAAYLKRLHKKRCVDDWNIDGVPYV